MECKDCEYRPELCFAYGSNLPQCPVNCLCCECQLIECPYNDDDLIYSSDDLPF